MAVHPVEATEAESSPSRLVLKIRDRSGNPIRATGILLLAESKALGRKQYRFERSAAEPIVVEVPAAGYSMQFYVPEHETARQFVDLQPGRVTELSLTLEPRTTRRRSFEERLAKYDLDAKAIRTRPLTLDRDQGINLNYHTHREKSDFAILRASSVEQLKKWVGNPDHIWGHDRPVYGPLPVLANTRQAQEHIA